MTGEQLYGLWSVAMLNAGCIVDPWGDLEAIEQEAWDEVARQVVRAAGQATL